MERVTVARIDDALEDFHGFFLELGEGRRCPCSNEAVRITNGFKQDRDRSAGVEFR